MNSFPSPASSPFVACLDCQPTLARLIGNVSGFVYRRRFDPRWTMDFLSSGCRDVTGYDPHRFIGNASLAFGELVAREDQLRVDERVRLAARRRQRTTVDYFLRTAWGTWLRVEDRLTPVVNADGEILAVEGIIDRARSPDPAAPPERPEEALRLVALCPNPTLN